MRIEWNDVKYLKAFEQAVDKVLKKGAKGVVNDARKNITGKAKHPTGTLARQIEFKVSQFKDGGYIVEAQGPGNYQRYYAIFVELGTSKMKAMPYLRPAIKKAKFRMRKLMEQEIGLTIK